MIDNIRNLLDNIESVIFQLLSWLVLVPKELFFIVAKPAQVPQQIQHQLSQPADQASAGISPIFLYLIVAVLPYWALEQVETKIHLIGPETLNQHDAFDLRLNTRPLRVYQGSPIEIRLTHDGRTEAKWSGDQFQRSNTLSWSLTANEPGLQRFNVEVRVNDIKVADDDWSIHVRPAAQRRSSADNNSSAAPHQGGLDSLENALDSVEKNAKKTAHGAFIDTETAIQDKTTEALDSTPSKHDLVAYVTSNEFMITAIGLLIVPLMLAIVMLWHSGQTLDQNQLRPEFYTQCAYFSPLMLGLYIAVGLSSRFAHEPLMANFGWWIFALIGAWFVLTQIAHITHSLRVRYRDAIGIVSQYISLLIAVAITLSSFSTDTHPLTYARVLGLAISGFIILASSAWLWLALRRWFPTPSGWIERAITWAWSGLRRFYGAYLYIILILSWVITIDLLTGDSSLQKAAPIIGGFTIVITLMAAFHRLIANAFAWVWAKIWRQQSHAD